MIQLLRVLEDLSHVTFSQYAHLVVSDKLFNDLTEGDMQEVFEGAEQLDHWFGR